ncbi:MAG: electron transport complex subunit E [Oscillospiraceae bacterium]|nr:electron transport complex subunit E [Oscillospiraceae bacterium]
MKKADIVLNGILKENPALRLVLGTCPTLAVTTLAMNGLGMGLSATFVLIFSGIAISALRNVIPSKVRLPAYITIIATFVTILMLLVRAYLPALNSSLGVYLPLIVVNCIILGRAEMFASKNKVFDSALDGLGMGLGFTLTLVLMGTIREILGNGSIFGLNLHLPIPPMIVFITPPGGFFVFGILMAAAAYLDLRKNRKKEAVNTEPASAEISSKEDVTA